MTVVAPKLTLERRLLRECDVLIALDEVGRGALAGPVAVGAVAIDLPVLGSEYPRVCATPSWCRRGAEGGRRTRACLGQHLSGRLGFRARD